MGRRKKPTNRELVEGIVECHTKINYLVSRVQQVLGDYIDFTGNSKEFTKYLEKKYNEDTSKKQHTKKSK